MKHKHPKHPPSATPEPVAGPNEGEGSRTAARRYDEATRRYIDTGRSDAAAKEAEAAVEGKRGKGVAEDLARAEERGKEPGAGDDDPRPRPRRRPPSAGAGR